MKTRELALIVSNTHGKYEATNFGRDTIILLSLKYNRGLLNVECEVSQSAFDEIDNDINVEISFERPSYHALIGRNEFEETYYSDFRDKFGNSGYGLAICTERKFDFLGFPRGDDVYVVGFYDEILIVESNSMSITSNYGAVEVC